MRRDYYSYQFNNATHWSEYKHYDEQEGMISARFNAIWHTSKGLAREVLLTRFLLEMMDQRESLSLQVIPLMDKYYHSIKNRVFTEAVIKKYKLRFDKNNAVVHDQNINLLKVENNDEFLPSLIQKFKGKVVYIDIWATWCSPCIREMKYYPKLIDHFKGKNLEFIFLAAYSPENLWKNQIQEFSLKANHYLLSEQEYINLEKYFELKGFPQHLIINKQGEIIESSGPRIFSSDGTLNKQLLQILNDLLAN